MNIDRFAIITFLKIFRVLAILKMLCVSAFPMVCPVCALKESNYDSKSDAKDKSNDYDE